MSRDTDLIELLRALLKLLKPKKKPSALIIVGPVGQRAPEPQASAEIVVGPAGSR